jgi:hypothetical protein
MQEFNVVLFLNIHAFLKPWKFIVLYLKQKIKEDYFI